MITLSSDFGSPYPASMRGVILGQSDARLVDISHDFPRGDVRTAAFWLREVLPYFPPAVHLAVIDPTVGSGRDVLVVRAGEHRLVGPDNGLLVPVARRLDDRFTCFRLTDVDAASNTFHGRDVFAPLAATIHEQPDPGSHPTLQPAVDPVGLSFPDAELDGQTARGTVLVIDGFGNAITNVPGEWLTPITGGTVCVDDRTVHAVSHYAAVEAGRPLVTVGSTSYVELAVNGGRGDEWFGLSTDDAVTMRRPELDQ